MLSKDFRKSIMAATELQLSSIVTGFMAAYGIYLFIILDEIPANPELWESVIKAVGIGGYAAKFTHGIHSLRKENLAT